MGPEASETEEEFSKRTVEANIGYVRQVASEYEAVSFIPIDVKEGGWQNNLGAHCSENVGNG
mgnify:CR=1 FL=1